MKIALVQMDVAHGKPVENKKHVKEMLERALSEKPDVNESTQNVEYWLCFR